MNSVLELYLLSKLITYMTQDWTETDAYKLGIIDKKGNFLKKYRQLKTSQERSAFSTLHRFAFNLKKLIESLPGGKSKVAKYLTVFALFREEAEKGYKTNLLFEEEFSGLNRVFTDEFGEISETKRENE
jgi:hypothetical protein